MKAHPSGYSKTRGQEIAGSNLRLDDVCVYEQKTTPPQLHTAPA